MLIAGENDLMELKNHQTREAFYACGTTARDTVSEGSF